VYGGGFVGPIAFGFIAAQASFPVAWLAAAAAMLLAGILMVIGRRMLMAHRDAVAAARLEPRAA
jgi:dipeptide/tripeptide permease